MKKFLFRFLFMLPVLTFIVVYPAAAQIQGTIEGVVVDAEGFPLPGGQVTLTGEAVQGQQVGRAGQRQPPGDGLQGGGVKPPDPVGIPWGRELPADISFSTSAHSHSGHFGSGSLAERVRYSKQLQQPLR